MPADIVNEEIKAALADGFRELMPITHPAMTEQEIEDGAKAFFRYPGTALLRLTQDLRNSIHAGRWMRSKRKFVGEHFAEWCQFGTILGGEVRMCLLHLIMQRDTKTALDQMSKLTRMLDNSSPELRRLLEEQVQVKLNS